MKYGEIQAVVQLCVALNVGIFALRDLAVPFYDRQLAALEGFHEQALKRRVLVDRDKGDAHRSAKLKAISEISDEAFGYMKKMKEIRINLDENILRMSISGAIFAGLSLWMLFRTAAYYNNELPNYEYYSLLMFYFVFIFSVGIFGFARIMAYGMGRYVRRSQIKLDRAISG